VGLRRRREGARGAAGQCAASTGLVSTASFVQKLSAGFVEETSQFPPVSCVGGLCVRNVVYGEGWEEYVKIV
jgi:hypothetical protein